MVDKLTLLLALLPLPPRLLAAAAAGVRCRDAKEAAAKAEAEKKETEARQATKTAKKKNFRWAGCFLSCCHAFCWPVRRDGGAWRVGLTDEHSRGGLPCLRLWRLRVTLLD